MAQLSIQIVRGSASFAAMSRTPQPVAFQSRSTVPLLPSMVGARNSRVDITVPIAGKDPTQNLLVVHALLNRSV